MGGFQEKILDFYAEHGRELPWRNTRDPYHVLVSEIMLQQTQVDRVIPYYEAWLRKWPTKEDLAKAEKSTVLKAWSGLGYNSRALRLWRLAKELAGKPFPTSYDKLIDLPGIGSYTANAVLSFAFNHDVAVVDTNIRRVLMHELQLPEDTPDDKIHALASEVLPKGRSRDWHNALMDYGATVLTAKKTGIAPVSKQSKFEGSDRQVRGWVMKQLTKGESLNTNRVRNKFPKKDVKAIVNQMVDDGLVKVKKQQIVL